MPAPQPETLGVNGIIPRRVKIVEITSASVLYCVKPQQLVFIWVAIATQSADKIIFLCRVIFHLLKNKVMS